MSFLKDKLDKLKIDSALFIGGDKLEKNFSFALKSFQKWILHSYWY